MFTGNQVVIVGNVGTEVEFRETENSNFTKFTLASSEADPDKKSGQRKQTTEWHRVVAWGNASLESKEVKKGDRLIVIGKVSYKSWDKKDGTKGYATEINAFHVASINKKHFPSTSTTHNYVNKNETSAEDVDDLPF